MSTPKTVVICCAGLGSRLGLGIPKALLKVGEESIISRHLRMLGNQPDIRIVVGYKAGEVIDECRKLGRRDVTFVYNRDYLVTNTWYSLFLGSRGAFPQVLSLDGDLMLSQQSLNIFLDSDEELLGYCDSYSQKAVGCVVESDKGGEFISGFTTESCPSFEWTGVVLLNCPRDLGASQKSHVFEALKPRLPIRAVKIDCAEIDTWEDYQYAKNWLGANKRYG